jgi:hypothetical protein
VIDRSQRWDDGPRLSTNDGGQHRGRQDYGTLFLRTMRYSLRRALSLDSVDGCTHNPMVDRSDPPVMWTIVSAKIRHQFGTRLLDREFASEAIVCPPKPRLLTVSGNNNPVKSLIVLGFWSIPSRKCGALQHRCRKTPALERLIPSIFPCLQGFRGEELV